MVLNRNFNLAILLIFRFILIHIELLNWKSLLLLLALILNIQATMVTLVEASTVLVEGLSHIAVIVGSKRIFPRVHSQGINETIVIAIFLQMDRLRGRLRLMGLHIRDVLQIGVRLMG